MKKNVVSTLGILILCLSIAACTWTRAAYREAGHDPYKLAYVTAELYYAQLKEANRIKDAGAAEDVVRMMQDADDRAQPYVHKMVELGELWKNSQEAKTEEELREVTYQAANAVADFVDLLKRLK